MIVRLTHPQWNAVRSRISPEMFEIMKAHRKPCPSGHDYTLPAIGWKRILDELNRVAYGPLGGKKAGADSLYRAIARIADAVGKIESHPALTVALAVHAISNEVIPVWINGGPYEPFARSPYPQDGWRFAVLYPSHLYDNGRDLTIWIEGHSDPHQVLHDPAFHLRVASI